MPPIEVDPDVLTSYLEDAAHYPGGHTLGVARPRDLDEVAAVVAASSRVLPIGAQSSLTGGATPHGGIVLSTEHLQSCYISGDRVTAGAGVSLETLQQQLADHGRWFPPVPTFLGAKVGGAVATNAAGAATFKYGPVRRWVEGITVVLANGHILSLARGDAVAAGDGTFEIVTGDRHLTLHIPELTMPSVPKCSAGYYAKPGMDLIDLFIGSEGTLGVIVDATLRVAARPAALVRALVPVTSEAIAIQLVSDLRRAAEQTWATGDCRGLNVSAIEHVDRRSLDVLVSDGIDRRLNISIPPDTSVILLVEIELDAQAAREDLWTQIADGSAPETPQGPLAAFCQMLGRHHVLHDTQVALPDDRSRAAALVALREAVPAGVNRRVGLARERVDNRIHKTAADMVVPFDRFSDMMRLCRRLFEERGLDLAVWGHISDGNVHPNVIPRDFSDVERGRDAILELGRAVVEMGGSPLAEHGVGRSPLKQALLRQLYGDSGIDAMRRVKQALDPEWKLAPGVLFEEN
jgi:D-lactate dehydrogenase (cytochrome)